jgi:hypothetical protein
MIIQANNSINQISITVENFKKDFLIPKETKNIEDFFWDFIIPFVEENKSILNVNHPDIDDLFIDIFQRIYEKNGSLNNWYLKNYSIEIWYN